MKIAVLAALAALVAVTAATPADARRHKQTRLDQAEWSEETESSKSTNFWEDSEEKPARAARQRRHREVASENDGDSEAIGTRHHRVREHSVEDSGNVGSRPSAWCGWYMRTRHGGGPEYNLAANWAHRGSASGPHVGAIVVWPHHVGEITGQTSDGQWIVLSGNDSHTVRERARSVAGAVFRSI
jgi:hypothetical protein